MQAVTSSELAAEADASDQAIAELEEDEERALRGTESGVTEEQRECLVRIRTDRDLHKRRLPYLRRRRGEVLGEEQRADAEELSGELAERQRKAVEKAKAALGPRVWARIARARDDVVDGLEDLQDAHRARCDRQTLRAAFELEEGPPIEEVGALELEVRERLRALEGRIVDLYGACDRTAGVGSGRVPHHASDEVAELLRRREELQEVE